MYTSRSIPWRAGFALSGLLILAGGPRHPGGTMAQMLASPEWVPSHSLLLAAFAVLLGGLLLFRREHAALPVRTRRWLRLAIVGTALQTVEMAFHLASVTDLANLTAGRAAPVLTTHLVLAVLVSPIFAATIIGLVVAGALDRVLASRWIAPIAVAGALAHGLAAPLVVLGAPGNWRFLFPGVALFAVWLVLCALWPIRAPVAAAPDAAPSPVREPAGSAAG
ncbi:hypothetical protein [Longimicrobium sp.]|uniref:hypothetical protein n=1 Tax=Longimicrobium sp. TaxID=2029185 RepID=UPI002C25D3D7|nr:hypothetical protein [Longimicrobium sp.]HSU16972.1 hypothetical protein [Longimicrobium sp.]